MSMTTQEVVAITRETNFGTWRFQRTWNPLHIVDAKDCTIIDGAGKQYLDFSSQLMCSNLGHKNPAVIASIAAQAEQLAYAMPGYATTPRAELSQLLLEVLPKGPEPVLLYDLRHRRQRGRVQDRPHVYRQVENHLALSQLPRQHLGLDCRHRRRAPLAHGAGRRQAAGSALRRPNATASAAPSAIPTRAATSPARTTSST